MFSFWTILINIWWATQTTCKYWLVSERSEKTCIVRILWINIRRKRGGRAKDSKLKLLKLGKYRRSKKEEKEKKDQKIIARKRLG